jgi:hypothetical protein
VRFVDSAEGSRLNRDYRARDYATNVLSFPYQQQPLLSGDLVLCAPVVAREATAQGKSLEAHYAPPDRPSACSICRGMTMKPAKWKPAKWKTTSAGYWRRWAIQTPTGMSNEGRSAR